MEIVEEIRKFVESECKKPTSKYGYEPYYCHFIPMRDYAVRLAREMNADVEIVELAAWLHDIGSIINGREDHHVTGAEIAEKKLKELNYPKDRIEKIKHCILTHRGSQNIKGESVEAQIIIEADSMSNFDNIGGIFKAAYVFENLNQLEAREVVKEKLINKYNQLSDDSKKIIQLKYEAAMLLLGNGEKIIKEHNKKHYIVATGVVVKDGKYLITKRAEWEKAFPGKWTVPGGKLEVDDYINEPKDTSDHWYNISEKLLKREVKEETGLEIKDIKYLTSMTFIRPDNIPVFVISLYADHARGDVKLSDDMTDFAWVSLEEAKNYDLIEGIYEELEMLDKLLKGEHIGEWKKEVGDFRGRKTREGCRFCNKNNLKVIKESDNTISFLSKNYLTKGHCLIIPKDHYESILDMPRDVLIELMHEVCEIKKLLVERFGCSGVDIRQNYRPFLSEGDLKVDHIHFHLIPREFEDELYQRSTKFERDIFSDLDEMEAESVIRRLKNENRN